MTENRWVRAAGHTNWLDGRFADLIDFSANSIRPDGGFDWLDANGTTLADKQPELFLTARMVHTAAIASIKGFPGSQTLLEHGVASLLGLFADTQFGGWFSKPDAPGRKSTYDHVHVALAASSAIVAGEPRATELLDRALAVIEEHLWDETSGALVESYARDWSDPEPYRGANANMHGVEAMLAVGDVTGDAKWHRRALGIADRLINHAARDNNWVLPEHYDTDWQVILDYNRDKPADQFRPYGATPGHALEWARLVLALYASPALDKPEWCLEAARELLVSGLEKAWAVDGHEGLPYTLDWDNNPVVDLRLHWPFCEAIQACAMYDTVTGGTEWEHWYRKVWDFAVRYFMDPTGTWSNELTSGLERSESVWPGRPDVYHLAGAYAVPQVGASPFVTAAVAGVPSKLG